MTNKPTHDMNDPSILMQAERMTTFKAIGKKRKGEPEAVSSESPASNSFSVALANGSAMLRSGCYDSIAVVRTDTNPPSENPEDWQVLFVQNAPSLRATDMPQACLDKLRIWSGE
jgi:hypothetical protein